MVPIAAAASCACSRAREPRPAEEPQPAVNRGGSFVHVGLIDELHLFTHPFALGGQLRLFADGAGVPLTLDTCDRHGNGVVHRGYLPA